jgi:hypothetical protein
MDLQTFLTTHAELTENLYTKICLAYRNASILGTPEAYDEFETLDIQYSTLLNDPVMFAHAKIFHDQDL